jgi:hypothetical protein
LLWSWQLAAAILAFSTRHDAPTAISSRHAVDQVRRKAPFGLIVRA